MGYESLIQQVQNRELKETPVYGRVKSEKEREYDRLSEISSADSLQHDKEVEQHEEDKERHDNLVEYLERIIKDTYDRELREVYESNLREVNDDWKEQENAWAEKTKEWEKKKEKREGEETQKGITEAVINEWEQAEQNWNDERSIENKARYEKTKEMLSKNELGKNLLCDFRDGDYTLGKKAQRALEQAVKLHYDPDTFRNVPNYVRIFLDDPSKSFESLVTGESKITGGEKTKEDLAAKKNHDELVAVFSSNQPKNNANFLEAVYTKLKLILDPEAINKQNTPFPADRNPEANPYANPFFSDRGHDYADASDDTLVNHANQLVNLYELAEHADDFVKMLPDVPAEDVRKSIEKEEIIERMNMLKSQKGFLKDELMRLEALANPWAPSFDLTKLDTVKALADFYESGKDDEKKEIDPDFWALCENCFNRWNHRAVAEIEAAESLLRECIDNENVEESEKEKIQIMMVVTENNQKKEVAYSAAEAKKALLAAKGDETVRLYFRRVDEEGQQEKIAVDLKNDGKMAWATYKTQIDCDCTSLDPGTLPKKPGVGKMIWHWIIKHFTKVGVPEVEEYENAKAKLEEATRKAKEFLEKKKSQNLTVDESAKDNNFAMDNDNRDANVQAVQNLLEQEQKEREEWAKLQEESKKCAELWKKAQESGYGQFRKDWDQNLSEEERRYHEARAREYYALKEKWEKASESDRQKSRITALRSSKMLERRAVKKAEERAARREEIKAGTQMNVKDFSVELFRDKNAFTAFPEESRDILVGKSAGGIDCSKLNLTELERAIKKIQEKVADYKELDGKWKSDTEFEVVASWALRGTKLLTRHDENKYAEAKNYFDGRSKLEVFDGLCNEDRSPKDEGKQAKADAVGYKRRCALGKAIVLHAENRIEELKKLIPAAEKKDVEKLLQKNAVSVDEVRDAINSVIINEKMRIINDPNNYSKDASCKAQYRRGDPFSGYITQLIYKHRKIAEYYVDLQKRLMGWSNEEVEGAQKKGKEDPMKILEEFAKKANSTPEALIPQIREEINKKKNLTRLIELTKRHSEFQDNPIYKSIFENPLVVLGAAAEISNM